jgi:hypothetical protein
MYGFTATLTGTTFEQALARTLAALKAGGFGVLTVLVRLASHRPGLASSTAMVARARAASGRACCD